jgi:MFS family permease
MLNFIKVITAPLLSLLILMIAVGLFSSFVPVRLDLYGQSTFVIGLITAGYFSGLVLGSLQAEKYIARIGHIRTFSGSASLMASLTILMGLTFSPLLWFVLRFFIGFFTAGLFIVVQSWLLMLAGREKKGSILSYYMIVYYAGQAGGQFLLGVSPPLTLIPFSVAALLMSASVVPVSWTRNKSPTIEHRSSLSFFKLYRISPTGIFSSFGSGLIMGAFFGFAPVFSSRIGMDLPQLASFMGLTIIGGFVLQWPIGRLSDHFDRRKILMAVSFITAVLSLLIAVSSLMAMKAVLILSVLFGGFSFTLYPLSISYTNDYLGSQDLVAATGGLLLAYGIGSIVGPLLAPFSMQVFGSMGLYVYMSAIAFALGAMGFFRQKKKGPFPLKQQIEFISLPTTPKIAGLDPRIEEKEESRNLEKVETTP